MKNVKKGIKKSQNFMLISYLVKKLLKNLPRKSYNPTSFMSKNGKTANSAG
jgi:hypothetical protein